jgi:hypothetical protein
VRSCGTDTTQAPQEENKEESGGAFLGSVSAFGDFDFRVTARRRRIHGRDDTLHMPAQYWPLRIAQHNERDCANRQILLVADILIFLSGVTNTLNLASSAP